MDDSAATFRCTVGVDVYEEGFAPACATAVLTVATEGVCLTGIDGPNGGEAVVFFNDIKFVNNSRVLSDGLLVLCTAKNGGAPGSVGASALRQYSLRCLDAIVAPTLAALVEKRLSPRLRGVGQDMAHQNNLENVGHWQCSGRVLSPLRPTAAAMTPIGTASSPARCGDTAKAVPAAEAPVEIRAPSPPPWLKSRDAQEGQRHLTWYHGTHSQRLLFETTAVDSACAKRKGSPRSPRETVTSQRPVGHNALNASPFCPNSIPTSTSHQRRTSAAVGSAAMQSPRDTLLTPPHSPSSTTPQRRSFQPTSPMEARTPRRTTGLVDPSATLYTPTRATYAKTSSRARERPPRIGPTPSHTWHAPPPQPLLHPRARGGPTGSPPTTRNLQRGSSVPRSSTPRHANPAPRINRDRPSTAGGGRLGAKAPTASATPPRPPPPRCPPPPPLPSALLVVGGSLPCRSAWTAAAPPVPLHRPVVMRPAAATDDDDAL